VLRREQTKSPVHDRQHLGLRRICRDSGGSYFVNPPPVRWLLKCLTVEKNCGSLCKDIVSKLSKTDSATLFVLIPAVIASLVVMVWLVVRKTPAEAPADPASPPTAEVDPTPAAPRSHELTLPQLAPMQLAVIGREQQPTSKDAITTPEGWEKLPAATAESGKVTFETPLGWEKIEPGIPAPSVATKETPASTQQTGNLGESSPSNGQAATASDQSFPTEQRVWTNYQGQLMVASVLECDFKSGELVMRSDDGTLRNYQLFRLSNADRDFLWQFSENK
jgi:hypothetical protein